MNPLSIWGLVAVAALIPLSAGGADANPTEGRNMTYDFNSVRIRLFRLPLRIDSSVLKVMIFNGDSR